MTKFRKWLIENYGQEAWNKFKANVKNGGQFKTLKSLFESNTEFFYVDDGFVWGEREGYDYWSNIDDAWVNYTEGA